MHTASTLKDSNALAIASLDMCSRQVNYKGIYPERVPIKGMTLDIRIR